MNVIFKWFVDLFFPFHESQKRRNIKKTSGFLMFSEGIERDQWHEID